MVSKYQPNVTGRINWALSIYKRIKQPWLNFKHYEDKLSSVKELWDTITDKYIKLAVDIDTY